MKDDDYTLNEAKRHLPRFRVEMDGTLMKILGCAAMFFYSLSISVIQNGLLHVADYGPDELAQAMSTDPNVMLLSGWAVAFQLIGGLAVPVFAFLLVEGFLHTSDLKRYMLGLVICSVVSEAPYDLCMYGTWWSMRGQNAMFTYAISLMMLYILRMLENGQGGRWFLKLVVVAAAALWCVTVRCAFGLCTVLLAAIYYLWREQKSMKVMLGCAVSVMYITAPISGFAIWLYNGRRGKIRGRGKYVFYALYPLHLLVLGLIGRAL